MATALLLAALIAPITLFWLLRSRWRWGGRGAAAASIAVGWILDVAWAQAAKESVALAAMLGWICPAVLVLLTALVWHFVRRRAHAG